MTATFLEVTPRLHGEFELYCDRDTARLIVDALEVINPDDPNVADWARECAFNLSTSLDRWNLQPPKGD
jgi:hypothetical protein